MVKDEEFGLLIADSLSEADSGEVIVVKPVWADHSVIHEFEDPDTGECFQSEAVSVVESVPLTDPYVLYGDPVA